MGTLTRILVFGAVLLAGVGVGVTALAARGGPDPGPLAPIVVVDPGTPTAPASTTTPAPTATPTPRPSRAPTARPTRSEVPVVPPRPTRVDDDDDDDDDDRGGDRDDD